MIRLPLGWMAFFSWSRRLPSSIFGAFDGIAGIRQRRLVARIRSNFRVHRWQTYDRGALSNLMLVRDNPESLCNMIFVRVPVPVRSNLGRPCRAMRETLGKLASLACEILPNPAGRPEVLVLFGAT